MIIKKFLVSDMNEAMTRIKYELGSEAVIVSQKKVRAPGFKGYFTPSKLEVTAAVETFNNNEYNKDGSGIYKKDENRIKNQADIIYELSKQAREEAAITTENLKIKQDNLKNSNNNTFIKEETNSNEKLEKELLEMNESVKEMQSMLQKVVTKDLNAFDGNEEVKKFLQNNDISEDYFTEISDYLNNSADLSLIKDKFSEEIVIFPEDIKGKVALIGPTGVGKTTTIAKLAGKLALIEKKKVGLITIDTYRIGAVEQLRAYAEIMNIPFRVVVTTKEMEDAISEMKDLDVLLIDTTGRSSKNSMQISELRAYIQKSLADHTLLVLSSTTKNKDIKTILKGYSELNYDKVIITKLDETMTYGSLYTIIKETKKPIAFITTGQNVPSDIKVPTKEELVKLIIGEDDVC